MTDLEQAPAAAAGPELLARGRYALSRMPNRTWVITRAGPLCERCEGCGCGDQQDPITVPVLLTALLESGKRPSMGDVKRLFSLALGSMGAGGQLEDGGGDG